MRLVSLTSPALLIALSLLPFTARAQSDDELTDEELAAAEAEAEAEAKAEEEAKAKEAAPPAAAPAPAPAEPASEAEVEEAAPADLEGMFEPGQEPFRKPPKGKGVIWGRLVDEKTGEPAIEAQITVKGTKFKALTDFDGYYRLEVPPGTYTIEVFYELHEPASISGVGAAKDKVSRFDAPLKPQGGALEEVVIQDEAEKQTVAGLAIARQRSASQGDAIGRAEISKGTDSNAAAAAQRVVGANIVGGRFVYVRGLGERYSNSLLGGFPLPSPEPDRAAVPLDVFPATVLDSLTIAKTFTPDMPGDFAGGSVQIETRSVPEKPLFSVSITGGLNTQSTFQDRLDYPGSGTDVFGFDSGMRSLPPSVPTDTSVSPNTLNPEQFAQVGRDLNSNMVPRLSGTPPNHSATIVAGNTWTLRGGGKIGVLASLNYGHAYERYENMVLNEYRPNLDDERGFESRLSYLVQQGVEKIRWGAFSKVSYMPSQDHKISLTGLHSQLADDQTSVFAGTSAEAQLRYAASQLSWVERGMTFGMLSGRHTFKSLDSAEFGWDASLAQAVRNEPDRRDVAFQYNGRLENPENPRSRDTLKGWVLVNQSESGRHFFANQKEGSVGGKLDWMQPIVRGENDFSLKFGGLANLKDRSFSARRLALNSPGLASPFDPAYVCYGENYRIGCPGEVLLNERIPQFLIPVEGSQQGDAYRAHQYVYAGYLMLDYDIAKRLRLVGGARVEVTDQRIVPLTPFGAPTTLQGANIDVANVLPAAGLVFSATKQLKTRLSFAQTLARPQTREIAPFLFADYFGGRLTTGNPNLQLTRIDNLDARIEFWPSISEVIAFTAFFKHLDRPIETILVPTDGSAILTYENARSANLLGLEFEVRKNLGFLTSVLRDFSLISNFTMTYSRTEVRQTGAITITNPSRALINQAPWVVNAALDYENDIGTNVRFSYNINGPSIVEVGTEGLPDAYLHPINSLDLAASQKFAERWSVNLAAQNIANDDYLVTQGPDASPDRVLRQYTTGTVLSAGFGYNF